MALGMGGTKLKNEIKRIHKSVMKRNFNSTLFSTICENKGITLVLLFCFL